MSCNLCNRIPLLLALALPALVVVPACGKRVKGASKPSESDPPRGLASSGLDEDDEEPQEEKEKENERAEEAVTVTASWGRLDAQEIQAGVSPHAAALNGCYQTELKQKKFLTGRMLVEIRVNKTGQVYAASVAESDLGDWAVERCVLGIARRMTFAQPEGGDRKAMFKVPLNFSSDQTTIETWPEEKIAGAVTGKRAQLDACAGQAGGTPAAVIVTLYVGNRGAVKAVGFAPADGKPVADAWAECAARAVSTWTMADPMGKIVKASFRYGPGTR
jgi:TonB family protein